MFGIITVVGSNTSEISVGVDDSIQVLKQTQNQRLGFSEINHSESSLSLQQPHKDNCNISGTESALESTNCQQTDEKLQVEQINGKRVVVENQVIIKDNNKIVEQEQSSSLSQVDDYATKQSKIINLIYS